MATTLNPDMNFIREILSAGGGTLKKCYQCATCSVVCPITPVEKPYPRKEMIMAQLGMKDFLMTSPDIWHCHNCNDCSKYCPRGARPGDVMGALRQMFIREYSVPRVMGSIVTNPNLTIVALMIPLIIFLTVLGLTGHLHIPEGRIVYSHFFPIPYIEAIFIPLVALAGVAYIASLRRYWNTLKRVNGTDYKMKFGDAFVEAILEFLPHNKFAKCGPNRDRRLSHVLVFYGFVALFIVTCWLTFYDYVMGKESPIPLSDPMKWLANMGALSLLLGSILVIINRLKHKGVNTKSSGFDWTFAIIILLLTITGILTEVIRLAGIRTLAYPIYMVHLMFVFYTIVYFPYSKLAHMGYRTLAITYYKMIGKDTR